MQKILLLEDDTTLGNGIVLALNSESSEIILCSTLAEARKAYRHGAFHLLIIDINLPDINSKMRSIKDLKGKVALLDFTLYGAKESAERTRLLRTLYEKYHAQGFEIYQISLDEDIHFWKFSCENLPWVCVHETDGTTTQIYNIVDLPTFFLVNRNNEIVVRSDFMEGTLEDNIQRLL